MLKCFYQMHKLLKIKSILINILYVNIQLKCTIFVALETEYIF